MEIYSGKSYLDSFQQFTGFIFVCFLFLNRFGFIEFLNEVFCDFKRISRNVCYLLLRQNNSKQLHTNVIQQLTRLQL